MTNDNPVLAAMRERRSIRRYTDDPVEKQDILAVLDAGRWAPSGLNNQPCRFLVLGPDDPRRIGLTACTKYAHIVRGCHSLIAVLLQKDKMYNERKDHQAAGAAVQNMLLAVHALGLGAVWLGEIVNQEPQALEALHLDPARYELQAVLALGHPDQTGSSDRLPLSEIVLEDYAS
ncbi:MAG: nitroreductase [Desulfovibrionaceae bacterium]